MVCRSPFSFAVYSQNAWRLPDLQNKDTGELPLLHVYELDPMPEVETDNEDTDAEKERKEEIGTSCSFLALAQRKTELVAKEVLHPLTHRVFGTPLLLRIADMEELTGRQIYDLVAKHLKNVVPASAVKFLEHNSAGDDDQSSTSSSHEIKPVPKDEQTKYEIRQRLQKTMTDAEQVAAGSVPRYGFRLRLASRDGRRCALCPWYECCIGCLIPDDSAPTVVMNGDSIVIDWHFAVDVATNGFGMRVNNPGTENAPGLQGGLTRVRLSTVSIKNHSSCGMGKKQGQSGTITLEACLDAFAKEEKIPEVGLNRGAALVICRILAVSHTFSFSFSNLCRPIVPNARISSQSKRSA